MKYLVTWGLQLITNYLGMNTFKKLLIRLFKLMPSYIGIEALSHKSIGVARGGHGRVFTLLSLSSLPDHQNLISI